VKHFVVVVFIANFETVRISVVSCAVNINLKPQASEGKRIGRRRRKY
jgi:hypothetical protein